MDIATIVGLIAAITCLMVGIGPHLSSVIDAPALIVVAGGTLATALISNPLQDVVKLVGIYLRAIFVRAPVPTELIERIVGFTETARREGILALGRALTTGDDPFLAQGVRLAVDGTEPDLIMDILKTELQFIEERHAHAQRMVGFLGMSGLVFGGIGATLAISFRLGPEATGLAVASTAALPLTYGLVIFGVFAEPFRRKLRTYGEKESLAKRMIIEGIMSIQSSDNPRIVEHKLSVFLEPRLRPRDDTSSPAPSPLPAVDDALVAEVRRLAAESKAAHDDPPRFEFDDVLTVTDQNLQNALREIDQKDVVVGLKGASEPILEKFLDSTSGRTRTSIVEEMGYVDVSAAEIAETQSRIAAHLRLLAKQGKIELPETGP